MSLSLLGMNYRTAPVTLREKLVFDQNEAIQVMSNLQKQGIVDEALLFSTCNRTELYIQSQNFDSSILWNYLASCKKLDPEQTKSMGYQYQGMDAVQHLFRVASGLDSMILGEVEVLGQLKNAYRLANDSGTLGRFLNRLFQFSFSVAKTVRTKTSLCKNPISLASIAVRLSERIFESERNKTVLLIGAGHVIQSILVHLQTLGFEKILIANRTAKKWNFLPSKMNPEIIDLQSIPSRLREADIIMSATSSALPILGKGMVESALKTRKRRPMLMIDLAVPRDIEPEVSELEDVYLYGLDDLQGILEANLNHRKKEAIQAENIILRKTESFMQWLHANKSFKTLRALHEKYDMMRETVLVKALNELKHGKAPTLVLEQALNGLTNQLLHMPTQKLRKACSNANFEILKHTQYLFELNDEIIDT